MKNKYILPYWLAASGYIVMKFVAVILFVLLLIYPPIDKEMKSEDPKLNKCIEKVKKKCGDAEVSMCRLKELSKCVDLPKDTLAD